MSQTAQKKDISDPEVVERFAGEVGTVKRLQHLYLLTVADISGTSPALLNSWKSGLLWELYQSTIKVLERGGEQLPGLRDRAEAARREAAGRAHASGFDPQAFQELLDTLPDSAFMRFNSGQLRWALAERMNTERGRVVAALRDREDRAVTELFVSAPDYTGLIATTTTVLDELRINVLSARVVTTTDGFSFDLFQLMDRHGQPLNRNDRRAVAQRLEALLAAREVVEPVRRRLPRRLRPFVTAPVVQFGTGRGGSVTSMEVTCTDRPGLLSQLAAAMVSCGVRIHDAMIATLGDRVEDTFLVSDQHDQPLDGALQERLKAAILQRLEPELAA